MKYADIKIADVANGEGVRVSLFVSGCNHHCKGCFNAQAWDFNYGNEFTEKEIDKIIEELDHPYVAGLSLLGGEPLEYANQKGLLPLLRKVKEKFPDKNIWCYTGYTYEAMLKNPKMKKLLSEVDVLVDGKFILEERSLNIYYRGSRNQRVIDVPKSLKQERVVLIDRYMKDKSYEEPYKKPDYMFI